MTEISSVGRVFDCSRFKIDLLVSKCHWFDSGISDKNLKRNICYFIIYIFEILLYNGYYLFLISSVQ